MKLHFLLLCGFSFGFGFGLSVGGSGSNTLRTLTLHNGREIPQLGVGTAALEKSTFAEIISAALESGFRLFDSAQERKWYDERLLGDALSQGNVERKDLFLVTKVMPYNFSPLALHKALNQSLQDLRTDYLDLVLIHFPHCFPSICNDNNDYNGDWKSALRMLRDDERVKSFGVSNFDLALLRECVLEEKILPHVVQNWMDPLHKDLAVRHFAQDNDIVYMAYSSFGGQHLHRNHKVNPVLSHPRITEFTESDPYSVILRWGLNTMPKVVMIPRSNNVSNIQHNAQFLLFNASSSLHSVDSECERLDEMI